MVDVSLNLSWKLFSMFSAFILKKMCQQIYFKILSDLDLVKNT